MHFPSEEDKDDDDHDVNEGGNNKLNNVFKVII